MSDLFWEFDQNIVTFVDPYSVTNKIEEECGSDIIENDENNIIYYRLNDNFNDDDPEINIDDFSVTSQDHSINLSYLNFLPRDNDHTEYFIIPTYFIPTTNSGDIALKVQEKVKYGFKFSSYNISNNFGSLMTINKYDIKGRRYVNHHMQKLWSVDKIQYIPLFYSEGMLFPSLNCKSTNYKCPIVGAIPSRYWIYVAYNKV